MGVFLHNYTGTGNKRCVYSFFTSAGPHCTLPFNTTENETYLETTVSHFGPPPRLLAPPLQRILFKSAAIKLSKSSRLSTHERARTHTHIQRERELNCRVINSPCLLARGDTVNVGGCSCRRQSSLFVCVLFSSCSSHSLLRVPGQARPGQARTARRLLASRSSPVEAEALGEHDALQVLVLLLLPEPLLLQEGHQSVALLHHLQHLVQDLLLLRQLLLRLQVV